ncbi:MNN4-regulates the mannosylphosphorylation [Balamuthia mandrillaris]
MEKKLIGRVQQLQLEAAQEEKAQKRNSPGCRDSMEARELLHLQEVVQQSPEQQLVDEEFQELRHAVEDLALDVLLREAEKLRGEVGELENGHLKSILRRTLRRKKVQKRLTLRRGKSASSKQVQWNLSLDQEEREGRKRLREREERLELVNYALELQKRDRQMLCSGEKESEVEGKEGTKAGTTKAKEEMSQRLSLLQKKKDMEAKEGLALKQRKKKRKNANDEDGSDSDDKGADIESESEEDHSDSEAEDEEKQERKTKEEDKTKATVVDKQMDQSTRLREYDQKIRQLETFQRHEETLMMEEREKMRRIEEQLCQLEIRMMSDPLALPTGDDDYHKSSHNKLNDRKSSPPKLVLDPDVLRSAELTPHEVQVLISPRSPPSLSSTESLAPVPISSTTLSTDDDDSDDSDEEDVSDDYGDDEDLQVIEETIKRLGLESTSTSGDEADEEEKNIKKKKKKKKKKQRPESKERKEKEKEKDKKRKSKKPSKEEGHKSPSSSEKGHLKKKSIGHKTLNVVIEEGSAPLFPSNTSNRKQKKASGSGSSSPSTKKKRGHTRSKSTFTPRHTSKGHRRSCSSSSAFDDTSLPSPSSSLPQSSLKKKSAKGSSNKLLSPAASSPRKDVISPPFLQISATSTTTEAVTPPSTPKSKTKQHIPPISTSFPSSSSSSASSVSPPLSPSVSSASSSPRAVTFNSPTSISPRPSRPTLSNTSSPVRYGTATRKDTKELRNKFEKLASAPSSLSRASSVPSSPSPPSFSSSPPSSFSTPAASQSSKLRALRKSSLGGDEEDGQPTFATLSRGDAKALRQKFESLARSSSSPSKLS